MMQQPVDGVLFETGERKVSPSLLMRWVLLSALWIALAFITAAQSSAGREIDWLIRLSLSLMDWGPWILLSPIVLWFARRFQMDGGNWLRILPLHIIGAVVIALAAYLLVQGAFKAGLVSFRSDSFRPWGGLERRAARGIQSADSRRPPPYPQSIRARFSIPIYCVLVAASHAMAFHRRSLQRESRALLAEARLAEVRLGALQAQLNPHFLFNALNAVSSLVYVQPQAADEMLCALGTLLRRVLASSDRREVSLAEELELVDLYLSIQCIRFADKLEIHREIQSGLDSAAVPTLILQPLVENAVIHGTAPSAKPSRITLRVSRVETNIRFEVSDTGNEKSPLGAPADSPVVVKERVGLGNTRARLNAIYGQDASVVLTRAPEGGLRVCVTFPLRPVTPL